MSEVKKIKPSLSEGTRDFLPSEVAKRNYIFDTIKTVFRKYGFEEIETPAIEKLETLTGKYGNEGDQLLFKIRSNRNLYYGLSDELKENLQKEYPYDFIPKASDKGLRYDLTVPLARYVVMHQDKLAFPFKRFHIGQVWRGDKPQKGRYQEFYQCDADVIGSTSLLNEVELLKIYFEVFKKLKFNDGTDDKIIKVKVNNRKLLMGVVEFLDIQKNEAEFFTIIDKYDKIGRDGVLGELEKLGLSEGQLRQFISIMDNNRDGLLHKLVTYFENLFATKDSSIGREGLTELTEIMKYFDSQGPYSLKSDILLARGLNYYTGLIVEITLVDGKIGSLGGGGRYDNLTEMFGGQNMSGVGISFGIERIYDEMERLGLFQKLIEEGKLRQGVDVLFFPYNEKDEIKFAEFQKFAFEQVEQLRAANISAEIFLGNVKKQKQAAYADQKNITYTVEVGENEVQSGKFRLRNAKTRDTQNDITLPEIIQKLS